MLHLQPAERDVRGHLGEPVDEEQTVRVVLENQALETEEEGGQRVLSLSVNLAG